MIMPEVWREFGLKGDNNAYNCNIRHTWVLQRIKSAPKENTIFSKEGWFSD